MNPPNDPAKPDAGLQFDRADFKNEPAMPCASCKAPIAGEYFQVADQPICPTCRQQITAFGTGGSKMARVVKAAGAGIGAGFVGFVIYYAVLKLSGINFGLIAIVVGWMVGAAVRWGSDRVGGWLYQLLAVGITYVSICATYIPLILGHGSTQDSTMPLIAKFIFAFVFSLAMPWLEGPSNIIGWLILGFGLYQAWVMNKKLALQVTGPFHTTPVAPATPPALP